MEEEVSLEPSVCDMTYYTVVKKFSDTLGYNDQLREQVDQYMATYFLSGEAAVPVITANSAKIKTTTKLQKGASGQIILQTLTDGSKRLVKKLIDYYNMCCALYFHYLL